MPGSQAHAAQAPVSLSAITPTRFDEPIELAVHYLRTALLNEPDVIAHLHDLATLRAEDRARYVQALWRTPLGEQFSKCEIDHMAATIVEKREAGYWGLLIPTRPPNYGRQKPRARAMTEDTLELAVADFIYRLNPAKHMHDHLAAAKRETVRTVRRRARALARP